MTNLARAIALRDKLLQAFDGAFGPDQSGLHIVLDALESELDKAWPSSWWTLAPLGQGLIWLAQTALERVQRDTITGRCKCGNGTYEVMRASVRCTNCSQVYDGPEVCS